MTSARTPATLRLPASRRPVPTSTRLRTRRVPLLVYAVVLVALPVAVLAGARATGWWVTTGHTVASTALGADLAVAQPTSGPGAGTGAGEGSTATVTNPHDVKGSMTVQQILDAFPQVTAAELLAKFGAPASTPTSTQLKTLAQTGNGYEVTDLREWLETRQGAR